MSPSVLPSAEAQGAFDGLMSYAITLGRMLADAVLAGAPPPWEEAWFEQVYDNCVSQSAVVFRATYPQVSETIIANMQVRFCDGFEARLKEVLGGGGFSVGSEAVH